MNTPEILAIFVYGTLQRGESREKNWPHIPLEIRRATTRGALFDLGPYPALVAGDDVVRGELWYIQPNEIEATLRVLDKIEGFNQGGTNLYERIVIDCIREDRQACQAYCYRYCQPINGQLCTRVLPDSSGTCGWR